MSSTAPKVHHAVFAVSPERFDAATEYLEALGFRLHSYDLPDVGLAVRLDWNGGVELVTPTDASDQSPGSVADFLARHGDGVYSVVARVNDADASADLASRYGAETQFRQRRDDVGLELLEVQLSTVFGIPLTLLTTNLP